MLLSGFSYNYADTRKETFCQEKNSLERFNMQRKIRKVRVIFFVFKNRADFYYVFSKSVLDLSHFALSENGAPAYLPPKRG